VLEHDDNQAPAGTLHRVAEDFVADLGACIPHPATTAGGLRCSDAVRSVDGIEDCPFRHVVQVV
jgi:hypothetical protein